MKTRSYTTSGAGPQADSTGSQSDGGEEKGHPSLEDQGEALQEERGRRRAKAKAKAATTKGRKRARASKWTEVVDSVFTIFVIKGVQSDSNGHGRRTASTYNGR
ncbi:hypothetical protein FOL47_001391, partial [Perkinsus chesapeaki]